MRLLRTLKSALLIISLSSCSSLPRPEVWQCQHNGTPRAFYCVNTKTKAKLKLTDVDSRMRGAQCLSPADYLKTEAWVRDLKKRVKR
jgi:hypothetical protein